MLLKKFRNFESDRILESLLNLVSANQYVGAFCDFCFHRCVYLSLFFFFFCGGLLYENPNTDEKKYRKSIKI